MLPRKREQAIAALLACGSIPEAAKQVGVNATTIDGWLKDPEFAAEFAKARRQILEGVIVRLQKAASKAVAALERNLECGTASVEVRAAESILTHTFRGAEVLDLAERLEKLEASL